MANEDFSYQISGTESVEMTTIRANEIETLCRAWKDGPITDNPVHECIAAACKDYIALLAELEGNDA